MRYRTIIGLNAFLLCLIFGIIFTSQALGFLGIYWRWIVVPMVIIVTGAALTGYFRLSYGWFDDFEQDDFSDQSLFTLVIIAVLLIFVLAVFGTRMILWPYSELAHVVPADFHGYHALRALDLVRNHSYWDMTIPYGEYPVGYEGLLAFSQALTGSLQYAGVLQFALLLWLLTTLILLLRRFARFPLALAAIISTGLLFVPPVYGQLLTVGKNDVLLSITVLAAILHGSAAPQKRFHPLGLAYVTLISIATKTGGLFVLVYLWGLIMWGWWQAYQKKEHVAYLHPAVFGAAIGLMFPGGLWVIRNLIRMGDLLSPELKSFGVTTIAANLTNPILYSSTKESTVLIIAAGYVIALTIFLWLNKRFGWQVALIMPIIALSFITTPLSAFHTPQSQILHVEWRYVLHGVLFAYVALVCLTSSPIRAVWRQMTDSPVHELLVILIFVSGLSVVLWMFNLPERIGYDAANYRAALIDEYPATDAEYDSIYDFVQQEIHEGVIFIEDVEPFYLSYRNPKVYVTYGARYPLGLAGRFEVRVPDYAVTSARHELTFDGLPTTYEWEIIYEDGTGRVYARVP